MPSLPQTRAASQKDDLPKDRETSTIPKAGETGNWVYPSPQQFYNALLRKNKEADETAMVDVIRVHNVTNEKTWHLILDWEKRYQKTCPTPSLLRFVGRSEELSLGAMWSRALSYRGVPFDRHDWYLDRCGQKEVRYVIDYYDDPKSKDEMQIHIDVRPAFDTPGAAFDRLCSPLWQVKRVWTALFGGGS